MDVTAVQTSRFQTQNSERRLQAGTCARADGPCGRRDFRGAEQRELAASVQGDGDMRDKDSLLSISRRCHLPVVVSTHRLYRCKPGERSEEAGGSSVRALTRREYIPPPEVSKARYGVAVRSIRLCIITIFTPIGTLLARWGRGQPLATIASHPRAHWFLAPQTAKYLIVEITSML